MKKEFIDHLLCLACTASDWDLKVKLEDEREVRDGLLHCRKCGKDYAVHQGILDVLGDHLPEEVAHEKEHAESFGYLVTEDGHKHPINAENLRTFRSLFLSLPRGDGSHFFKPGGSFDNQAGNARRFFETLELLKLNGTERVLEVGASFGWGSWYMARRGCEVTALDVTNYLMASDLYFEEDGTYFERINADMSTLPFKDGTFDIVFSHSVIHHCKDLSKLFREFRRVLRPGGRVVALHECAFGLLEDKSGKALQEAIHEGFNENAYTLPEWKKGALGGGFRKVRFHFFSLIEDYIDRKELRGAPLTGKLKFTYWLRSKSFLHRAVNFLTQWPRVLLRPKAWMMVASLLALAFAPASLLWAEETPLAAAGSPEGLPAQKVFQVTATAKKSYFITDGKVKKDDTAFQAIYEVNLPEKKIKRLAFFNPEIKEGAFAGLRANDMTYDIVHFKHDFMKDQMIIKGIGMADQDDGFEMIVIGEDFVTNCRSTKAYFEFNFFERTDRSARTYQFKHEFDDEVPQKEEKPKKALTEEDPKKRKPLFGSKIPKFFHWLTTDSSETSDNH